MEDTKRNTNIRELIKCIDNYKPKVMKRKKKG